VDKSKTKRKAIKALNSTWWQNSITKKQEIIYLSNYNLELSGLWCRSMANFYQRNK
jgi:hypothetical protein